TLPIQLVQQSEDYDIHDCFTKALRSLFGVNAQWKSEDQRQIIEIMFALKRTEGLIAVLPTGFGKSLLFLLPAVMSQQGVTVVLIPFRGLLASTAKKIKTTWPQIHCVIWNPNLTTRPRTKRLLLASVDQLVSSEKLIGFLLYLETSN